MLGNLGVKVFTGNSIDTGKNETIVSLIPLSCFCPILLTDALPP